MADEVPPLLPGFEENIKKAADELPTVDSVRLRRGDWVELPLPTLPVPTFLPKGSPVDPKDLAYARERLGKYIMMAEGKSPTGRVIGPYHPEDTASLIDDATIREALLHVDDGTIHEMLMHIDYSDIEKRVLAGMTHMSITGDRIAQILSDKAIGFPLEVRSDELVKRREAPKAPVEDGAKKRKAHPHRYGRDRNKRHRRV